MAKNRITTANRNEKRPFTKPTKKETEKNKEKELVREKIEPSDPHTNFPIPKNLEKRISSQSVKSIASSLVSFEDTTTEKAKHEHTPQLAWAEFNDTIGNLNDIHFHFNHRKEHRAAASTTFREALEDLCGRNVYEIYDLKSSLTNEAKTIVEFADTKMDIDCDDEKLFHTESVVEENTLLRFVDNTDQNGEELVGDVDNVTKETAKRGWKVLKRQVNETILEHKIQTHKLNWTMLRHTIRQMANLEDSRQDLYERYGVIPTTLPDGSVVCENRMLSDRARKKLYGQLDEKKVQKRPNSYQPPSLQMRNQMQKESDQRQYCNMTGGSNLTKRSSRFRRAVTAK